MTDNLGRNTVIYTVANIGTKMVALIMIPFYSACLTPSEYGIVDVVLSVVMLCVPIVTLQLDQSVFRFIFQGVEENIIVLRNGILAVNIFALLICMAIYPVMKIFSIDMLLFMIVVLWVVMESNYVMLREYYRGCGNVKKYAGIGFLNILSVFVCNIIFVYFCKYNIIGVFSSYIIADLLCVCYLARLQFYRNIYNVNKCLIKRMLTFSIPLISNTVAFWIINLSDRMFIVYYLSDYYNGLYAMACKISAIIAMLSTGFVLAWQQEAISLIRDNDNEKIQCIESKLIDILFLSSMCMIAVLPTFYDYFIDERYHSALYLAPMLILGSVFLALSQFFNGLLMASFQTINIGLTTVLSAIINVVINFLFLREYGIFIAALSTLAAYMVLFLSRTFYIRIFLNRKIVIKVIIYTAAYALVYIFVMRT